MVSSPYTHPQSQPKRGKESESVAGLQLLPAAFLRHTLLGQSRLGVCPACTVKEVTSVCAQKAGSDKHFVAQSPGQFHQGAVEEWLVFGGL